jgi:hypothetical protein
VNARDHFVHLGYAVGTGSAVMLPIRHMVVTGQTQESGKTTTLEALIARADGGRRKEERRFRAIAFITKRGEGAFTTGHSVQPYFRTQKADWQYVSSLIDATMGEKNKLLRSFLMKTCRGTATLADVLANVRHAKDTSKGFPESIYTEIEGYLELVVPQLAQLPPAHKLTLKAGLNVMDVAPYTTELQALVIRATLDHVYESEEDVVTVIPEAWEFLPEGRGSPVKAAAEVLIRKGAALGNYMWLDSQDLAGVWKTAVRACPVALIGVQREANEIKRTLANIHTTVKPKAADVAGLELGEFFACWGKQAVKTYVQPAGMTHLAAMAIARGQAEKTVWRRASFEKRPAPPIIPAPEHDENTETWFGKVKPMEPVGSILERVTKGETVRLEVPATPVTLGALADFVGRGQRAQQAVDAITEHVHVYGPGLTFGELAIGERFWDARPVVQMPGAHWPPPRGPLLVKTSATGYEFTNGRGIGTAQDYYRVERWTNGGEEFMSDKAEEKLDQLLKRFDGFVTMMNEKYGAGTATMTLEARSKMANINLDELADRELEQLASHAADLAIARLATMVDERDPRVAAIIRVLTSRSEIHVETKRHIIEESDNTQLGRIALLIAEGWFDQKRSPGDVQKELGSRGFNATAPNLNKALKDLAAKGFFTQNNKWFSLVPGVKDRVVRKGS